MNIRNWKIGTRLGGAFAVLFVLMVGCVWFGLASLRLLNSGTTTIVNDNYPKAALAYEVLDIVNRNARAMRNMLLLKETEAVKEQLEVLLDNKKENAANFKKLQTLVQSADEKALLETVLNAKQAYGNAQKTFLELASAGKNEEATAWLLNQTRDSQRAYFASLRTLIRHEDASLVGSGQRADQTYQSTIKWMLGLMCLALATGLGVAVAITRSITAPLRRAVDIARTVATGDLSSTIEVPSTDETGLLLQALKEMSDSLARIVAEVRAGADTIATASGQIAHGNLDLSSRTEEQASTLEETASSMEELTATVNQNADNAHQANQLAVTATDVATRGGVVVSQVVGTMGAINEASRKIVDIIGVIDGIAFQTNILALNAAVEAARAGEQGRGFAVVASEVRNLAQRSAAAAKEIKGLIGDSVVKVEEGNALVDQAGSTMRLIVDSIKSVTDIMAAIAAAGGEQTAGIGQINQAIMQMDTATQQNASLVEEAAAASQSLQDQAASLARSVSIFKLNTAPSARVLDLRHAGAAHGRQLAVRRTAAPPAVERWETM